MRSLEIKERSLKKDYFHLGIGPLTETWLYFRHWDGYDKPQWVPLIKLEENEYKLNGGRFRNFKKYWEDKFDYNRKTIIIQIKSREHYEDLIAWCGKNSNSYWSTMPYEEGSHYFWFNSEFDSILFKLTWL